MAHRLLHMLVTNCWRQLAEKMTLTKGKAVLRKMFCCKMREIFETDLQSLQTFATITLMAKRGRVM